MRVGRGRVPVTAVIGDPAAEDLQLPGDVGADASEPEDADLLAGDAQRERRIAGLLPAPFAHMAIVAGDIPRRRQEQRDGHVGHVVVEHVRRVGDDDAASARFLHPQRVGADAE